MGIITKREDFVDIEREANVTLPNLLSVARGVGGLALGYAMAKGTVSPETATAGALALAVSDAEGSLINLARNWPAKIRDGLRIWPSKLGVSLDASMDKVFMGGMLIGGIKGGYLPPLAGLIAVPEIATVATSAWATKKLGRAPEVHKTGKLGMIARFGAVSAYLASSMATNETISNILENSGHASTAVALGLGSLGCYDYFKQGRQGATTEPLAK